MKNLTKEQQIARVSFDVRRGYKYEWEECDKIAAEIVTICFPQVVPDFKDVPQYIDYFMDNAELDRSGNIVIPKGLQLTKCPLPGNNLGIRFVSIHRLTAFLTLFFPKGRKLCAKLKKL